MKLRQLNWRTGALILCLAVSLALSIAAFQVARTPLPDWIEIQEGPVAHGVDKFYRNVYMKGDLEVAGDMDVAGNTTFGYGATSYVFDFGTSTVTDTLALTLSNVTTPTVGFCTLGEDPDATEALCSMSLSGITATLKLWNAGATGAGSTGTQVHWMVIGQ